jgi:hypothetical protein
MIGLASVGEQPGDVGVIGRVRAALPSTAEEPRFGDVEFDLSEIFFLLSNERRRRAVQYVIANDDGTGVALGPMAEAIAVSEHDSKTTTDQLSSAERARVRTPLYQDHLDKLDDAGLVEYDKERGLIYARNDIYAANRIVEDAAQVVGGDES